MQDEIKRYIVVPNRSLNGSAGDLAAFIAAARSAGVTELEVVPKEGEPKRAIVHCLAATMESLRSHYGERLNVELDQPLELL